MMKGWWEIPAKCSNPDTGMWGIMAAEMGGTVRGIQADGAITATLKLT